MVLELLNLKVAVITHVQMYVYIVVSKVKDPVQFSEVVNCWGLTDMVVLGQTVVINLSRKSSLKHIGFTTSGSQDAFVFFTFNKSGRITSTLLIHSLQ